MAIKTHNTNIDEITKLWGDKYNLFFICSERYEYNKLIDPKYKLWDNVIVFEYNELNETVDNTLDSIVDNIYNKIFDKIPHLTMDKMTCKYRIDGMNLCYEEIKSKSFDYVVEFYHIHGSHRNRING